MAESIGGIVTKENRPLRESIWSVAGGWTNVYFAIFTTLNVMNIARVVWFQATQAPYAGWSPMVDAILDDIGRGALGIVCVSLAITDIGRFTMVLAGMFEAWVNRRRERQMAEAVAEGRAEGRVDGVVEGVAKGRVETDALWRAWNGRRLDAVAKGEPFDEPPPDIAEPSGNGR